ncbi:PIN domain-containing protein [Candidatus Bathyarchaeota archaeon]|nr:PIN domain-containing protein [Candidatus Bathyarchaeota archaeon]
MPLIELDMLIAFVNVSDELHRTAVAVFEKIAEGELKNVVIPASAYMEYELVLRSRGYNENVIREDVESFRRIPNLGEAPLTSSILIEASRLRERYRLSYFDSLHAASALSYDRTIVSVDQAYQTVAGLKAIDPRSLANDRLSKPSRKITGG